MQINSFVRRYQALGFALFCTFCVLLSCDKESIITDEILMLTRPAADGLRSTACANFTTKRTVNLSAGDSVEIQWSEGVTLPNDTLRLIRLAVTNTGGSVDSFTMSIRPLADAPDEIQCMKGFGCGGAWVSSPWVLASKGIMDDTIRKFQVLPQGTETFFIKNYNAASDLVLAVNPDVQ